MLQISPLKEEKQKKKRANDNIKSLAAEINRDLDAWDFSQVVLDEKKKVELLATMVQLMVLLLTSTTCYKFGGVIYKQVQWSWHWPEGISSSGQSSYLHVGCTMGEAASELGNNHSNHFQVCRRYPHVHATNKKRMEMDR